MNEMIIDYDVALSFAGENRPYVEMVAKHLKAMEINVFYDAFETSNLWGKDLYEYLTEIYSNKAKYTVIFISEHYQKKAYPTLEKKAAQAKAFKENQEYILPVRFDDTEVPGILPTTMYIDLRDCSPYELAILISKKLGMNINEIPDTYVPPPESTSLSGIITFNYSTHNGYYVIGNGLQSFTTRWGGKGASSIHCYRTSKLKGIALALDIVDIAQVDNASNLNYSSDSIGVREGEIVILKNINGFYTGIKILDVKLRDHGDPIDELVFEYWILSNGEFDFSKIELERAI